MARLEKIIVATLCGLVGVVLVGWCAGCSSETIPPPPPADAGATIDEEAKSACRHLAVIGCPQRSDCVATLAEIAETHITPISFACIEAAETEAEAVSCASVSCLHDASAEAEAAMDAPHDAPSESESP